MPTPPDCPTLRSTLDTLATKRESLHLAITEAAETGDFDTARTLEVEVKSLLASLRETMAPAILDASRELFKQDFLGPEEIGQTFGFTIDRNDIPLIPFSKQELEEASARGEMLVLNWDVTREGEPLTIERMAKLAIGNLPGKSNVIEKNRDGTPKRYLLYEDQFEDDGGIRNGAWFSGDRNMLEATPERGWQLVSQGIIPNSTSKNYPDQTQLLVDHIKTTFPNGAFPKGSEEKKAEEEWERERPNIRKLIDTNDDNGASESLSKLEITKRFREPVGNTIFRYLVAYKQGKQLFTDGKYSWSGTVVSDGYLANFGGADAGGAFVRRLVPRGVLAGRGVVFSRRRIIGH